MTHGSVADAGTTADSAAGEVRVDRLVPGGEGFGRGGDGRPVFVPGGLPGDRIRATSVRDRGGYLRAESWDLVAPGPERVAPPCGEADRCGGCDWMRLSRPAQVRSKAGLLREALVRTGGFRDLPDPLPVAEAGPDLGYRGRLRLHVDPEGRVGLFARGTHEIVEIATCPVSAPEVEAGLGTLRRHGAAHPGALGEFSGLELRAAPRGAPLLAHLFPRQPGGRLSPRARAFLEALARDMAVAVSGRAVGAPADQRWPLPGGVELRAPPLAFTQVNPAVNDLLVRAVVDGALARDASDFCDLYCGAGNFTLPLLAAGLRGVGIEASTDATRAARAAAHEAGLRADVFLTGDVPRRTRDLHRAGRSFELAVLDPPRTGARDALPLLLALAPRHVAYVSCDPVTLARDLRHLAGGGYTLDEVRGFDMFPHTHHVEALAWLRR
ncbi:TRAM domain-containing protein [Myxococcota bacterium]|nr:TRAM domain-containing protein [Myxococcota bacterium]